MGHQIKCKKCDQIREHYAKNLCKTCYNEPYVMAFRMRPDYKKKHCEYQLTYYIKQTLQECEQHS